MRATTNASSVRAEAADHARGQGMGPIARSCLRLGIAATVSLFLSLLVLMFLFDTNAVGRWFLASAVLAALSFGAAVIANRFEP